VVTYYSSPIVYTAPPRVAYTYAAPVAYYTPVVSYAPPPVAVVGPVAAVRYGPLGRPRAVSYYYYP
jgi:hypothetical protein